MADAKTTGKEFLAGVLARLPESLRAQAQATFDAADADAALTELGAGVLRQQDYSRNLDAVRTKEQELTTWHGQLATWQQTEEARIAAALDAAQRASNGTPTPQPVVPAAQPAAVPANVVTKEDLDKFGNLALGVIAVTNRLSNQHYAQFGQPLDMGPLLSNPRANEIGLEAFYRETYKEQLDAKAAEAEAKRTAAIEEGAIARYRAANPNLPYPVVNAAQPSTLDALESKADPSLFTAEAAANEYARLVALKLQSSGA